MVEFYEQLLDNDLNPYILFSSSGKLINFNKEAEYLFNFVTPKELFELALKNASKNFGFSSKFINIKYKKQTYYAIMVGYINDEELALRLYKEVEPTKSINIDSNYHMSNIYTLITLSKNTSLLQSKIDLKEEFDVSIPELKIDINEFLLILNHIFNEVKNDSKLSLKVSLKTGEYEIINKKRYHIICVKFTSQTPINLNNFQVNKHSLINIYQKENIIELEIPLII
jgi:nitrogen-specific signal transduction histidine kinase